MSIGGGVVTPADEISQQDIDALMAELGDSISPTNETTAVMARSEEDELISPSLKRLEGISVTLRVVIGRGEVLVRDLTSAHVGSLWPLDNDNPDRVSIYLQNKLFAYGRVVVTQEGRFGILLEEFHKDRTTA